MQGKKAGIPGRTFERVVKDGYGVEMRSYLSFHKKLTNVTPNKYYTTENAKDGILQLLSLNKRKGKTIRHRFIASADQTF